MIRINQLKLPIDHKANEIRKKIKKELNLKDDIEFSYQIKKRSIDARKKPELFYVYSVEVCVENEDTVVKKAKNKALQIVAPKKYQIPGETVKEDKIRPIIVGFGPAGLFCAYLLVQRGFRPIILERGRKIEDRTKDVLEFWKNGTLLLHSNVQFGEGGAGTFSDGKLNTSIKDPKARIQFVLETFVKFGASEEILYDNKPHIGTDELAKIIVKMREYLIEQGCEIHFETCVDDLIIENHCIKGVLCDKRAYYSNYVVLAIGHSARDTFEMLYKKNIEMESKQFAVGFRIEHPQDMINEKMYGTKWALKLPASPYKVTSNFPNGRGVYSFCMCPGGYVVNASSKDGMTAVNGMSYSARDGKNANSAIIVSVGPKDFGSDHPLAGVKYQEMLEHKVFELGQGKIPQQLFGDFCRNQVSKSYGSFVSETKGETVFASLRGLMSDDMEESFIEGMKHFDKIIPGFAREDAIMSGMETRTSSPIRMNRDEFFESTIKGLYPCGEGAGYAGGITSAAMDGMKIAEVMIEKRE